MSIKERTWEQIQFEETQYTALTRLIDAADQVVEDNQTYTAGEGFKRQKRLKAEGMQRLVKEMYRCYGNTCNKFPEVRFQIYPNSSIILNVTDGKKLPYYSF